MYCIHYIQQTNVETLIGKEASLNHYANQSATLSDTYVRMYVYAHLLY